MPRMETGMTMEDFGFDTPFETGRTLAETVRRVEGKTALLFLRYYGCTLCQYDIHRLVEAYDRIRDAGAQVLVVLQSKREGLRAQLEEGSLPFDLICDPDQALYQKFCVLPAASQAEMMGPNTMEKVGKAEAEGFVHGEYEGDELQLPAVFIMDKACRLSDVHYGATVDDVPGPEELEALVK